MKELLYGVLAALALAAVGCGGHAGTVKVPDVPAVVNVPKVPKLLEHQTALRMLSEAAVVLRELDGNARRYLCLERTVADEARLLRWKRMFADRSRLIDSSLQRVEKEMRQYMRELGGLFHSYAAAELIINIHKDRQRDEALMKRDCP